mmetsp:Transcript_10125/g.20200  ORF Transcript_10125/g.20200 Transcript_10125/m.20200 type:complete len:141 (+) Transcript_10125:4656-5078(+)
MLRARLSSLSTAVSNVLQRQVTCAYVLVSSPAECTGIPTNQLAPSTTSSFGAVRFMSKYLSKSATKRLPLSPKRAKKGYYKGNGSTKEGYFGKGGKFVVDPSKRLELVVPDLTGFNLKPYVAQKVPRYPPELKREAKVSS